MKPARFFAIALIMTITASMAFAAGTAAGTLITNKAYGDYEDAQGNTYLDSSNVVTTEVAQKAVIDVSPATAAKDLVANSFVLYTATITNGGNFTDTIDLTALVTSTGLTGSYSVEIYSDNDGVSGVIDGTDAIVADTGPLAADATFDVIIKVIESGTGFVEGESFDVTLTATSSDAVTNDTGVYTSTIIAANVTVTITGDNVTPNPGETITYAICLDNTGSDTAYDVIFELVMPTYLNYVAGSIRVGTLGWDNEGPSLTDGGGDDAADWNVTTTGAITVDLGDIAAGGSICVYYQATVDPATPPGTDIVTDPTITHDNEDGPGGTAYDDPTPGGTGETISITNFYDVTVAAVGGITDSGYPNDQIVYTFTVTNDGNQTDNFDLTYLSDQGWNWTIYVDEVTGNGSYDGTESAISNDETGNIGVGVTVTYFLVIDIPADAADGTVDETVVTATSQNDAGATDSLTVTTTVTAPYLTLVKSVSPTGNQPPGTTLTYTVVITNAGSVAAQTIVISDNIPTNTTYVPESMVYAGDNTVTDSSADSDGAQCDGTTAQFDFASIASGDSKTVSFQVIID
jgi:uncharacterized repeat protein (TIGR01451 family)